MASNLNLARRVVEMTPRAADPVAPAGAQLGLGLMTVEAPNLSIQDRAEAERRFAAIEPLVAPERYPLETRGKGDLVAWLAEQHQVKKSTLYQWRALYRDGGLPALVRRDRADKGKPRKYNQADLELIVRAALPQRGVVGVLTVADIYRLHCEERAWRDAHVGKTLCDFDARKYARYVDKEGRLSGDALLTAATYETMRRWFERIPACARILAREGEEAYRNSQDILSWREISATDPLDYVVMDHRLLDIFCLFPERGGWRLARPWLTAAIDMRTRKWLAWVIVDTPSSDSIAAVLKRCFLDHGVPKACYWDNGKDFRCEYLEGKHRREEDRGRIGDLGESWRGVLGTLGVRVHHAIVRNARAKLIEPNFGRIGDFDRTLPEYCGHKPGARPEWFSDLVRQHEEWAEGARPSTPFRTVHQVAELYDAAIEDLNERPLQGEGMAKITPAGRGWWAPNEAWDILVRRVEKRVVPADVVQFCFGKRKSLTIQHGEIKTTFGGRPFHYRIRGNPLMLVALNGQTIELAYDPLDLGEAAVYCDSRLVGLAECVALRRMGEGAFMDDERDRRAARREVRKYIAAAHAQVPMLSPEERLERRAAVRPARIEPERAVTVAAVPAAIAAAAEAAREETRALAEVTPVERVAAAVAEEEPDFQFFG